MLQYVIILMSDHFVECQNKFVCSDFLFHALCVCMYTDTQYCTTKL